ncbi:hypothetical protein KCU88_g147, partial [Aureobasidium melanogenum]
MLVNATEPAIDVSKGRRRQRLLPPSLLDAFSRPSHSIPSIRRSSREKAVQVKAGLRRVRVARATSEGIPSLCNP